MRQAKTDCNQTQGGDSLERDLSGRGEAFIALAEATGAVLYTTDTKLSKGHRARVALFAE